MSSGADRTPPRVPPTAPPRPTVPPYPAAPPRPSVPPRPSHPPEPPNPPVAGTGSGTAGPRPAGAADGRRPDGEQHQEDEPSAQMPHDTEAEKSRPTGSSGPSAPSTPSASAPGTGRPRPPVPTTRAQPPPPRGEPFPESGRRTFARPTAPPGTLPESPPEPALQPGEVPEPPPYADTLRGQATGGRFWQPGPAGGYSPRPARRTVAAAACLVLGVGLLGGSAAGTWLGSSGEEADFDSARALWHDVPVNELFPPTLKGKGAGPGGADRRWSRVAVAHDSDCRHAFDPLLTKALSPVGCARLVRATYADETSSSVTTVGMLFTRADEAKMRGLRKRFAVQNLTERTDLMPRPYSARGTVSADFGDAQRASWTLRVLSDAPVVVYAVTGFADGRVVSDPQSAAEATERGETSAAAQAGLGHDAQGIADRVERGLRKQPGFGSEVDD
jgi:hypothetical protein